MKQFSLLLLLLSAFAVGSTAQSRVKKVPNAEVKDLQGKLLNTSTITNDGNPMIISFWATWCGPCKKELNAIAEELNNTNITVTNLMPGATETDFGEVSGMGKTELFKNTASAKSVAEDGYNAMLSGKLDVISGLTFSQKIMMKMIPFMPKKALLKRIRKMQTVD